MHTGTHLRLVLWKAEKAVARLDRESIAGTGLGVSDFAVMEALLHKGPLPIGRIGEKVLLTSGSMTAAVDRLARNGFVRRAKTPGDARCREVVLTRKGRRVIAAAFARHANHLEEMAAVLTPEERDELVRLLKKIGTHAARLNPKATPP
jgi:MarR family 2-MHQ and catechol resistance regulon transcriptional repressor